MLVCHCHRVNDRTIRQHVREGADSVRRVARASRAGTCCGGCKPLVAEVVADEKAKITFAILQSGSAA